jgi:hypothetical protein
LYVAFCGTRASRRTKEPSWWVGPFPRLLLPSLLFLLSPLISATDRAAATAADRLTSSCRHPTILPLQQPLFRRRRAPHPHNPKILSLLRRLHRGQPRCRRLRGAAAQAFPRFSPLRQPPFRRRRAPTPLHNPKFLSLLRCLHHGQPRRRRLRGAAVSFSGGRLLPHLRRTSSPLSTAARPGPSPHACLQGYAARDICTAEGGV